MTASLGTLSNIQNPITRTMVKLTEPVELPSLSYQDEFTAWADAIFKAGWDATKDRFPVGWDPEYLDPRPFVQWKESQ